MLRQTLCVARATAVVAASRHSAAPAVHLAPVPGSPRAAVAFARTSARFSRRVSTTATPGDGEPTTAAQPVSTHSDAAAEALKDAEVEALQAKLRAAEAELADARRAQRRAEALHPVLKRTNSALMRVLGVNNLSGALNLMLAMSAPGDTPEEVATMFEDPDSPGGAALEQANAYMAAHGGELLTPKTYAEAILRIKERAERMERDKEDSEAA